MPDPTDLDRMIDLYRRSVFGDRHPDPAHLAIVVLDGHPSLEAKCPRCGTWGEIDDDQLTGKISTHHDSPDCGYHETKNWLEDHTTATPP